MGERESDLRMGGLQNFTGIQVIIDPKYVVLGARHNRDSSLWRVFLD